MSDIYLFVINKCRKCHLLALLVMCTLGPSVSYAQITPSDFVITVKTNISTPAETVVSLVANGNFDVYYESIPAGMSGVIAPVFNGYLVITLPVPGEYRLAFRRNWPNPLSDIYFGIINPAQVLTIEQWGAIEWNSLVAAFEDCINLSAIPATDSPILTNLTTTARMFSHCTLLSSAPNMKNWDVSNVHDMSEMFANCPLFNEPIGTWDVSKVNTLYGMFSNATSFNQPLNSWNVGTVTDLSFVLRGAPAFNQPLNNWDVSKVTNMVSAFEGATTFNQPLDNWDVSSVTNMFSMFFDATSFNQPLNSWNVGNVTSFGGMFYNASSFNQPLGDWDVSSATDFNSTFVGATSFNQPLNSWNVGNATATNYMFYGASAFNQPLPDWDVSKVTNMGHMFENAAAFNQNLGNWTLNAAVDMSNMLIPSGMDCSTYTSTLIGWANNPSTPSARSLTATGLSYGPEASVARDLLVNTKNWTITGDTFDAVCVSLPVTLVSFEVAREESGALLTWSTTEETNSDYFEIQKSMDGKAWKAIGRQTSNGESTVLRSYQYQDYAPDPGINYYRLKMVDRDETFAYSRVQSVDFGGPGYANVYPNPASGKLFVKDFGHVKQAAIYNMSGMKILETGAISSRGIDVSRLSDGLHTLKLRFDDGTAQSVKIIVGK